MSRELVTDYTFSPRQRTITFGKGVPLEQIVSIRNVTNGDLLYLSPDYSLVSYVNGVLTLPAGSVSLSSKATDNIQITRETSGVAGVPTTPQSTTGHGKTIISYPVELGVVKSNSSSPANTDKRTVLAELWNQSGTLRQVWIAGTGANSSVSSFMEDGGRIAVYVDTDAAPAISMTIAEFFGYKYRAGVYSTPKIGRTSREGERSSGYRYLDVPFTSYVRVEVTNTTATDANSFFGTAVIDLAGEKATYRRCIATVNTPAAPRFSRVTVLDTQGEGQIDAIHLAYLSATDNDFGALEGNVEIFVDGEAWPSWRSSGAEDAFNGGWYQMPVGGYPAGIAGLSDISGTTRQMYRFFPDDPIHFSSSVKVVVQAGQHGQGSGGPEFTGDVSINAAVSYALKGTTTPSYPYVSSTVIDEPSLSALSTNWNQAGDKVAFTGANGKATSTWGSDDAHRDMRLTRKVAVTASDYFVSTRVAITDATHDDQNAAVFALGSHPDAYYGSAVHCQLVRQSQYDWVVRANDDFDIVGTAKIDSGRDLTGMKVELALRVIGTRVTAYYRIDGQEFFTPVCSWNPTKTGKAAGVMVWTAGAEFDRFSVRRVLR